MSLVRTSHDTSTYHKLPGSSILLLHWSFGNTGHRLAGGHLPRQAADQTLQAQPGNQQGAAPARRCREPVQGDHQPEDEGHNCAGAELRQFESAAAEGETVRAELVGGDLPAREVTMCYV